MTDEPVVVGSAVLEALEKSLQSEGPQRLFTSGKKTGLFSGKKGSVASNQAIAVCSKFNLFTVSEVEETKGKTVTKWELGAITRDGLQMLFERRTPDEQQVLLEKCANPYKELAQDVLLTVAEHELQKISFEQKALSLRASQLRTTLQRIVEEQLTSVDQSRDVLNEQRAALQDLIEGITRPQSDSGRSVDRQEDLRTQPKQERIVPTKDADLDFQMQLCRELVFAWQDATDPEIRGALEPAMLNSGMEPVGELGEIVSFDNRDHRTDSNLLPGQAAVITERGWSLTSPRGTRLIAPAQVEATSREGDAIHEAHAQH